MFLTAELPAHDSELGVIGAVINDQSIELFGVPRPSRLIEAAYAGSVENREFRSVRTDTDLFGHGRISATLNVRKVVEGLRAPPVLPVEYSAHTYIRQDRDFMLVLARIEDGKYSIKTAQAERLRPRLASHCD